MATSVTTSLPMWLAGCTYDMSGGNDLRNSGVTPYFYNAGIAAGGTVIGVLAGVTGGSGLAIGAGTGMSVTVQPGSFVVPVSSSPSAGGYASTLSQQATLTVQTADPSNPRIDIVVANVVDNGNNTSFGQVQIITGTAAASPTAPSAPANSVVLAQVNVPAAATSIVSGGITDTRTYTTAAGGVLINPKSGGLSAGYNGMLAYDPASGSFYHLSASGPKQAQTLPWEAQVEVRRTSYTLTGSPATILAATITTDGSTDIKITASWQGISQSTPGNRAVTFTGWLDSTQLVQLNLETDSGDLANVASRGGSMTYATSSTTGDTPSSGSHTVSFKGEYTLGSSGSAPVIDAGATAPMVLRVEPVPK